MFSIYRDPLANATAGLLRAAEVVTKAVAQKKEVIENARVAIEDANKAIDEAQAALSQR